MKLPFPLVSSLIVIAALSACTRGKSKEEKAAEAPPPVAQPSTPTQPTAAALSPEEEWNEGRLPASITAGTPIDGGEVTLHLESEPPSLNPTLDNDFWGSKLVVGPIAEALVELDPYDDPNYAAKPVLAERWDVSDDKLVYTFHLRRNVKWHDGQPFTSRDVIATFDKVQDQTTKAAHVRSYFEELKSYQALDDFTVRFTWKSPYYMVLDALGDVPIQPAHVIGAMTGRQYNEAATNPINRAPLGTGPFKFVQWVNGEKIVLAKNADYWGKKAHIDRITFRIVKDRTVALQLAERGELETVEQVTSDQWVQMKDNAKFRARFHRSRYFDANYQWIGWNQERPFFKDKRVRRALSMLVDRPGMIEKLMYGLYQPTACPFYWKSEDCDPEAKPLPVNPAVALTLLNNAGWKDSNKDGVLDKDGVAFKFVFMIPAGSVDAERMGTKMKEDFGRVGIQMDVQIVEWSSFTKRLREHNFDACTLLWGLGSRQDPTQVWHSNSRNGGSNYVGFNNAEADQLITSARSVFDDAQRHAMYRRFATILHEEQPYTFLWVRPRLTLIGKRIKGVRENLEFWQWQDWWLEPTAK